MKTRTAWMIGVVLFFVTFVIFAIVGEAENAPWGLSFGTALWTATIITLILVRMADVENEPCSGWFPGRPPRPRPAPVERPREPSAKPTICAICMYVVYGYDERDDYLCKAAAASLEQHVDWVTGEAYYTKPPEDAGGLPLIRFNSPFPQCTAINTGDCPHFKTKEDAHET